MRTVEDVLSRGDQLDINARLAVEVDIQQEGRMIYFNVDGVTMCRVRVAPGAEIPVLNSKRVKVPGKVETTK